jgi:hypothetical protein
VDVAPLIPGVGLRISRIGRGLHAVRRFGPLSVEPGAAGTAAWSFGLGVVTSTPLVSTDAPVITTGWSVGRRARCGLSSPRASPGTVGGGIPIGLSARPCRDRRYRTLQELPRGDEPCRPCIGRRPSWPTRGASACRPWEHQGSSGPSLVARRGPSRERHRREVGRWRSRKMRRTIIAVKGQSRGSLPVQGALVVWQSRRQWHRFLSAQRTRGKVVAPDQPTLGGQACDDVAPSQVKQFTP